MYTMLRFKPIGLYRVQLLQSCNESSLIMLALIAAETKFDCINVS